MRHALLIRQTEESAALAERLLSKGVMCSLHPLITPHPLLIQPLHNPQALIITSKNALRALGIPSPFRHLPLYVVGDQTAAFARQLGYTIIHNASGTVIDLIALIQKTASKTQGILWHLSGDIIRGNPAAALKEKGFEAERRIVYTIETVQSFPPLLKRELKENHFTEVIFFSPRTASIFMSLLDKAGLNTVTHKMTALCLSQNVLQRVTSFTWAKVWASPKPTIDEMMRYFDEE